MSFFEFLTFVKKSGYFDHINAAKQVLNSSQEQALCWALCKDYSIWSTKQAHEAGIFAEVDTIIVSIL